MSIQKVAKFDPEIKQPKIIHETLLGASDINIQPFEANSTSVNTITWSLQVPTDQSFVDTQFNYEIKTGVIRIETFRGLGIENQSLIRVGRDLSLKPHAFMHMLRKCNIQFNNQSIDTDIGDYLNEMLMLVEGDSYNNCVGTGATTGVRKTVLHDPDNVFGGEMAGIFNKNTHLNNGMTGEIIFCDVNGNEVAVTPVDSNIAAAQTTFVKLVLRGELYIPPLHFNRMLKKSGGFYGIQNITITTTNKVDPSQFFYYGRSTLRQFATADNNQNNAFSWVDESKAYTSAKLLMKYKSPSLYKGGTPTGDCVIPFYEFFRYPFPRTETLAANTSYARDTRTVTLSSIPEYIMIWVKPSTTNYTGTNGFQKYDNDYRFPITNLSLIFGNRTGLFSTYTPQDLYNMSYQNGLKLNWGEFIGNAYSGGAITSTQVQTIGGFLLIKPGKDIPLDVGMVPNVQSNITMQANVTFKTPKNWVQDVTGKGAAKAGANFGYTIQIVTLSKSFLSSLNGVSGLQQRILRSEDVVTMTGEEPVKVTGSEMIGAGIFDKIKNIGHMGENLYKNIPKPARKIGEDLAKKYIEKKVSGRGSYPAVSGGRRRRVNLSEL